MKIIKPHLIAVEEINPSQIYSKIENAARNCYKSDIYKTDDSYEKIIKQIIASGHESVLEHASITVKFLCDIGVYKDLTRHRHASFSIESTRYCNYSKDKFNNELTFIEPCNIPIYSTENKNCYTAIFNTWYWCMQQIEAAYIEMAELGCKPDQLRMILPHSTAATVVMTANIREWRHIFKLRCSSHAHPAVQQCMKEVYNYFMDKIPLLFNDLTFD